MSIFDSIFDNFYEHIHHCTECRALPEGEYCAEGVRLEAAVRSICDSDGSECTAKWRTVVGSLLRYSIPDRSGELSFAIPARWTGLCRRMGRTAQQYGADTEVL